MSEAIDFLIMISVIDNLLNSLVVLVLVILAVLTLWGIYRDWKAGYIGKKYRKTGSPDY